MVFFIHIILMDKVTDTASSIGQTVEVTQESCVSLSKLPYHITRRRIIAAWTEVRKQDYGFTSEEEDDSEHIPDVELSDGELDAEDFEIEYDFSDYVPAAT